MKTKTLGYPSVAAALSGAQAMETDGWSVKSWIPTALSVIVVFERKEAAFDEEGFKG